QQRRSRGRGSGWLGDTAQAVVDVDRRARGRRRDRGRVPPGGLSLLFGDRSMMPGARRAYDSGLIAAFVGSALLFLVPQFFFIRQSLLPNLAPDVVSDTLSLENYRAIVTDPFYWGVFGRTIGLSVVCVAVGLLLAFPTAYLLARIGSRVVRWLIVLLLISSFVSVVVKVLGLTLLLGTDGPVVRALHALSFGLWDLRLLHNDASVAIGLVQYTLPLLVMILFGVIQNVPPSLEEAALVHGASDWRAFRR